jgi:vacuolar-type H+-ATPase subunit C/Vma6
MKEKSYEVKNLQRIISCIENELEGYTLEEIEEISNILESCTTLCDEILDNH